MNFVYWVSTILLVLLYLASATTYLLKTEWVRDQIKGLGYPPYLVFPLVTVKLAAVILIGSRFNVILTDLVYAGMFFHMILAISAHCGNRNWKDAIPATAGLILVLISFSTQNYARTPASPNSVEATSILSTSGEFHEQTQE